MSSTRKPTLGSIRTFVVSPPHEPTTQTSWLLSLLTTTPQNNIFEIREIQNANENTFHSWIDTEAQYRFPYWPWNGNQVIGIHAWTLAVQVDGTTSGENERRPEPDEKISLYHSILNRHMCSVGSIRSEASISEMRMKREEDKKKRLAEKRRQEEQGRRGLLSSSSKSPLKPSEPEPTGDTFEKASTATTESPEDTPDPVEPVPKTQNEENGLVLGSGLGHGEWRDIELEKALGVYEDKPYTWDPKVNWSIDFPSSWVSPEIFPLPSYFHHEAPRARKLDGACLVLKGPKEKPLAWYKPRCTQWKDLTDTNQDREGDGGEEGKEGGMEVEVVTMPSRDGSGVGVLSIAEAPVIEWKENKMKTLVWDDVTIRHVLLCAVAIEEQVMGSKGFARGKYHAW